MDLRSSLENPHPDTLQSTEAPLTEWPTGVDQREWDDLLGAESGREVRWEEGEGWQR